ncbi:MAG: ABC transporter permease [Bdellovibrionales bacterium]|nr:ABC transporter permease [Bdellovibrionales bacterium]
MTKRFAGTLRMFEFLGGTSALAYQSLVEGLRRPIYLSLIIEQIYLIGLKSLPLIVIVSVSTGMVMALQFGVGLEKFGGKLYVPKIVSLSIVRELGPVFASLMMAARVGAGITSEIGSMKVTQQIDAIRALGTSPIKKIVIPRIVACLVSVPIICVIANAVGIAGGLVVGSTDLGLDPHFYLQKVLATISIADYVSGLGKTVFFALFISLPACFYGLRVRGGTQGVGQATTRSVVTASILIMVGDFFLTKAFLVIERWFS